MTRFDPIESLAQMRHEFGEHGGVNMSIETSSTYTVMQATTMPEIFQGHLGPDQGGCYLYGRHFNPTVYVLGKQIAALEGAESAYCTASGMSAVAGTLLQLCNAGDHIVASNTLYGGTYALLHDFLPPRTNIATTFVDITDLAAVERAMTSRTKVVYCETISNPTLRVANVPELARLAHARGAKLVIDNTFCPLIIAPIQLGADVVVYSLTKFMNGASDVIAGAICGTTAFVSQLMDLHQGSLMLLGPTMDPIVAYDISLRLPHLGLRMAEHSRRALAFATRLQERKVPVLYTGLPTHPEHQLLRRLMNPEFGFGGLFCIDAGNRERAFRLMEELQNRDRFGFMAVSLGYFDTLMSCSAATTSSEMPPDALAVGGVLPGLVRISIGYTGTLEQRWRQMEDALRVVGML